MVKRQFLDFLYNHPTQHKKIYLYRRKVGDYKQKISPFQLLKEINEETELGKEILTDIEFQQKILLNMGLLKTDGFVQKDQNN